jgi:hypothetical protein
MHSPASSIYVCIISVFVLCGSRRIAVPRVEVCRLGAHVIRHPARRRHRKRKGSILSSLPRGGRVVASHARPNNHHATTSLRTPEMKVTIKEWNAVAAWRWDMPDDDVCGICRNPYDSTCSKCKFPGDECPLCKPKHLRILAPGWVVVANTSIVLGECNHSFHMVCFARNVPT